MGSPHPGDGGHWTWWWACSSISAWWSQIHPSTPSLSRGQLFHNFYSNKVTWSTTKFTHPRGDINLPLHMTVVHTPLTPLTPSSLCAWDSCANIHTTSQSHFFYYLTHLPTPFLLAVINGVVVGTRVAIGSIHFKLSTWVTLDVHGLLLVPSCKRNLFSGFPLVTPGLVLLGDSVGGGGGGGI